MYRSKMWFWNWDTHYNFVSSEESHLWVEPTLQHHGKARHMEIFLLLDKASKLVIRAKFAIEK